MYQHLDKLPVIQITCKRIRSLRICRAQPPSLLCNYGNIHGIRQTPAHHLWIDHFREMTRCQLM